MRLVRRWNKSRVLQRSEGCILFPPLLLLFNFSLFFFLLLCEIYVSRKNCQEGGAFLPFSLFSLASVKEESMLEHSQSAMMQYCERNVPRFAHNCYWLCCRTIRLWTWWWLNFIFRSFCNNFSCALQFFAGGVKSMQMAVLYSHIRLVSPQQSLIKTNVKWSISTASYNWGLKLSDVLSLWLQSVLLNQPLTSNW